MIQRIQSIYLLLAVIAIGTLFFFPLAELLVNKDSLLLFRYRGLYELKEGKEILSVATYPLAFLFSINLLLSLFAIFKFKNRKFQMKLCIYNSLLNIASLGLAYYYVALGFSKMEAVVHYKIFALMPIVASILSFMAYKGIQKDEKLIRSIDRIR
jgi:hypothetical protein